MGQKWSSHIWSISGPDKSETLSGPYMVIYGLYIQVISAQFLYKPDMNSISGPDMGQI